MRVLIAEDDFASRKYMLRFLSKYAEVDITVDGQEAVSAFELGMEDDESYDLVCLDVMMPIMDGLEALTLIRQLEKDNGIEPEHRARVIMTTALNEVKQVEKAFALGCEGYAVKPIDTEKFLTIMEKMGLPVKEHD